MAYLKLDLLTLLTSSLLKDFKLFNCAENDFVVAVSAFGSAAAGTVSVPSTVLATGIDDEILAKSFKTDVYTIQKLKAGFAPKA
ncbi:hypothetical protein Goari_017650 [Gossypium aridum]|uniref:Uncharacterized protein n=1 Tax=Gossypium aridum TaxID=34290 RepID=A0A7J8WN99_GOSAI|nr:hypothetical protein [Gossypium aridum]